MLVSVGISLLLVICCNAQSALTDPPAHFPLVQGWYEGRSTFYYDFGAKSAATNEGRTVLTAPLYVLVKNVSDPTTAVPGQRNIIDVIPGDVGYSDLWEVTFLEVPSDYVANSVMDAEQAIAQFETRAVGPFVNCPVVPLDSTLENSTQMTIAGWYKNQTVHYFEFGIVGTTATLPIYIIPHVQGQGNIIGAIPGDAGYTPFWTPENITVMANYVANTLRSERAVLDSGYSLATIPIAVNCPVVRTDEISPYSLEPSTSPTMTGGPSASPRAGSSPSFANKISVAIFGVIPLLWLLGMIAN